MLEALNMQLETVRTVLSNEVNEISVCVDLKRESGVFYTLISITSAAVRRQVAGIFAADGPMATNSDFIGMFSHGDSLSLVFLYRDENLLSRREEIYATTFVRRKQIVESFLVSLVETQITGSIGLLLLDNRNINLLPDGSVYFNYFLDFGKWQPKSEDYCFFLEASQMCFNILSKEYQVRYNGYLPDYPSELQVFAKKVQLRSFTSFNSILTFVKMIPDVPSEPSVGLRKLVDRIRDAISAVQRHSMTIFLAAVVLATVFYTVYQVTLRVSYRSTTEKNTTYIGLETIGEVYLGDETI